MSQLLTSEETELFLWMKADQMTLLFDAVSFGILPVFHLLSLKVVAGVLIKQVSTVTVAIWSKQHHGHW